MEGNDYTFRYSCDVCDSQPILETTGMCSVCTFGEASSMWEWLDEEWKGKEKKKAQKYVIKVLREAELLNLETGEIDQLKAMLMHIDQKVLDKIEELL